MLECVVSKFLMETSIGTGRIGPIPFGEVIVGQTMLSYEI